MELFKFQMTVNLHLTVAKDMGIMVVVQFYPWFNFYFLFHVYYHNFILT